MKLLPRLVVDAFESYCLARPFKPAAFFLNVALHRTVDRKHIWMQKSSALATLGRQASRT